MMIIILLLNQKKNSRRNIMGFRPLLILDGQDNSDLSRHSLLSLLECRAGYMIEQCLTIALKVCRGHVPT